MEACASLAPERPGKTSVWTTPPVRPSGDARPRAVATPESGAGTLDPVRTVFWEAYRHLFPPHALAAQTPNGSVVISWSVLDEPGAKYPYAAPILLRFEEALTDAMSTADGRQRMRIAHHHEGTLREGLRGYDPFARFPNARVIVIG